LFGGKPQLPQVIEDIPEKSASCKSNRGPLSLAYQMLNKPPLQIIAREGQMESATTSESYDIQYEKVTFPAAVCHRCGAKMFPAELLEAHMDRHELKDMYLQGELKKLQYSMNRMR
jgi:ribosomal protein S27AE